MKSVSMLILAGSLMLPSLATESNSGELLQRVPPSAALKENPFAGSEEDRLAGAKLFARECSACHGREAKGLGKAPPLAVFSVQHAQPGKLFWILRNGSLRRGMPSFAQLPEEERWQIVTFLKSLQDGL